VGFGAGADRIAWEAHIGGFAAGFFGIGYFMRQRRRRQADEAGPDPAG
jgi:membrane associated rhomboid family serine protease